MDYLESPSIQIHSIVRVSWDDYILCDFGGISLGHTSLERLSEAGIVCIE